ncbi:aldo/keto reductase [Nocardia sp. NPDC049707]|uniref:aldo/keto reductase n=1 Tax=Nocardia sp. NPDC049707 TaxID=3154735 RepID=UPI0034259162
MTLLLRAASHQRIGLGLAAVGRPGYITLGRRSDLPEVRSPEALEERAFELMDTAYSHGVRYIDTARSYGRAESFLAEWLDTRSEIKDLVIGSKWGYTYTADWRTEADVHEVKDHSVSAYRRQVAETRARLGDRLSLYQVHSVTPDSPALSDTALHEQLAQLSTEGVTVGLSTSGPHQADTIRAALTVTVGGKPLFGCVQTTYNLLERSACSALAEAHAAGRAVIIKEALANGRLTASHLATPQMNALHEIARQTGTSCDAVALAAVIAQPWADIVLSGAATVDQLTSNLAATHVHLNPAQLERLTELTEPSDAYWAHRSRLAWT